MINKGIREQGREKHLATKGSFINKGFGVSDKKTLFTLYFLRLP